MFLAGPSVPGSRPAEGRSVHWAPVASAVTVACLPHGPLTGAGLSQDWARRGGRHGPAPRLACGNDRACSAGGAGEPRTPRRAPRLQRAKPGARAPELGRSGPGGEGSHRRVGAPAVRGPRSPRCGPVRQPVHVTEGARGRRRRCLALAGFSLLRARCSLSEGVLEPDGGERKARVRGMGLRAWDLERRRPLRFLQRERLQSRLSRHSEGRTLGLQRDSGHGSCLSCLPSRGNRRSGQVTPRVPGGPGGFRARTWCRGSSVLPRSPGLSPRRSPQTVACRLCCF